MTDERALSEVLGFVLVFSIIVTAISVTYVFGLGGLQDTRDFERVNNAERAFDVLADNVEDLSQRRAPSRATEIKLADARLHRGEDVHINVSVPGHGYAQDATVQPIVYDSGEGTSLLYVSGAVLREGSGGTTIVRTPDFDLEGETVVVPVIQTRTREAGVAGSTTVLVRTTVAKRSTAIDDPGDKQAYINVTTPRRDAWETYLSERTAVSACSQDTNADGDPRVTCELDGALVERVTGSVLKVDYSLSG